MKQVILFFFATCGLFSYGQSPYIASIEILPQNPSTNDEIFLATHVATANLGQYLGSIVDITGNTVTVESCYFQGWSTQPQNYYDTISIGYLSSGNYNLNYTGYISWDNTDCDYQQSNSQDTTFYIEPFLSLNEVSNEKVNIYPNPTNTGNIYITSQSQVQSVDLIDLQGSTFSLKIDPFSDKYLISLSSFSYGTYFLSIFFKSGEKIRKRITLI